MCSCTLRAIPHSVHCRGRHFHYSGAVGVAWRRLLPVVLLIGGAACSPPGPKYETAQVSGKVFYKGKALPGGHVVFTADVGGLTGEGVITEQGDYMINAPVGAVHITVDTTGLSKRASRGPMLGRRGGGGGETSLVPGNTYVPIPPKYSKVDQTDLTFTVLPGEPQTHEIRLE
jgi:hypothetical protein